MKFQTARALLLLLYGTLCHLIDDLRDVFPETNSSKVNPDKSTGVDAAGVKSGDLLSDNYSVADFLE